jgi:hypothetical protein
MPKLRIGARRAQAKRRWLQEWDAWAATNIAPDRQATEEEAFAFYRSRKNAPGLEINSEGGASWRSVHGWLLEGGKVGLSRVQPDQKACRVP